MKKLLIKDLIKKDKQTLIEERDQYQEEWNLNRRKYDVLISECWGKVSLGDREGARKGLSQLDELLRKNADIKDIIELYNRALKRKGA